MASAMPVPDFLQAFFPRPGPPQNHARQCKGAPPVMNSHIVSNLRKAARASDERGIAAAWVEWMAEKGTRRPCPGYRLSLAQDQCDEGEPKARHRVLLRDGSPHPDPVCALFVFKAGGTKFDPWENVRKGDSHAQTRANVRGELTDYVALTLSRQHRATILLFFVNGLKMRLTRWQRGSAIFTEAFDYTQNRELLREVLRRFSRLDSRGLGFDCSVTPLSPGDDDYAAMSRLGEPLDSDISEEEGAVVGRKLDGPYVFKYVRAAFAASIAKNALRYRVSIPTVKGNRLFLVGRPTVVVAGGRSGRDTRGYVAWDVTSERFVWLKDVWRPVYKNVEMEGSVLQTLNGAVVRNVPTFVCDGALDQDAENPGSAKSEGSEKPSNTHRGEDSHTSRLNSDKPNYRHYRVVVEEVGMPLTTFKDGKQLVSVVRDCVEAHADAVAKAHILHGDISAGNVLISPTLIRSEQDGELRVVWKGLLIDWESSRPVAADLQVTRGTGTWEYTSAWILDHHSTALATADELESFFYVILYNALRFLRNTCLNVPLAIFDYFEAYEYDHMHAGTQYWCGCNKRRSMERGCLPEVCGRLYHWLDDTSKGDGHPINFMIGTLLTWFEARYTILNAPAAAENAIVAALAGMAPVTDKVREVAQKLEDHTAILNLLEECLLRDWPQKDKVRDLLEETTVSHDEQNGAETASESSDDEPVPKRRRKNTKRNRILKARYTSDDEPSSKQSRKKTTRNRKATAP